MTRSANPPAYRCPCCKGPLAKRDRRRRAADQLVLCHGVELFQVPNTAPTLRCPCGHHLVVIEGVPCASSWTAP